jgi:hypothetical protein
MHQHIFESRCDMHIFSVCVSVLFVSHKSTRIGFVSMWVFPVVVLFVRVTRQTVRRWSRWNGLTDILLVDSADKTTRGSARTQVASEQDPATWESILADGDIPAVFAVVDASACEVDRDVRRVILAWRAAFWRTSNAISGTELDATDTAKEPTGMSGVRDTRTSHITAHHPPFHVCFTLHVQCAPLLNFCACCSMAHDAVGHCLGFRWGT